ncbi:hypothetical protein GGS23DRAFT_610103 [Durotheca rogersii]|uniref:uncharacterized protein n=1 Tax=Durotheca rogersii TaxID=419775 RepID=UPI00221F2230|nr:uncharacterized protein GGS23DRAFT_610103 [Durotheca rogersii]KAI5862954.1 hypothetical protein GGS23DRAFT_610103 [Durotheca rogersii]
MPVITAPTPAAEQGVALWAPEMTASSAGGGAAPDPTEGPHPVKYLARRRGAEGPWVNGKTCGWRAGVSSLPWTCGGKAHCATDSHHVVACVEGTLSPFFSVCLDHAASEAGSCARLGTSTGCCTDAEHGFCRTFVWTGEPVRSMYGCFRSADVVTLLDVPQFVLDASSSAAPSSTLTRPNYGFTGGHARAVPESDLLVTVGGVMLGLICLCVVTVVCVLCIRRRQAAPNAAQAPVTNGAPVAPAPAPQAPVQNAPPAAPAPAPQAPQAPQAPGHHAATTAHVSHGPAAGPPPQAPQHEAAAAAPEAVELQELTSEGTAVGPASGDDGHAKDNETSRDAK